MTKILLRSISEEKKYVISTPQHKRVFFNWSKVAQLPGFFMLKKRNIELPFHVKN